MTNALARVGDPVRLLVFGSPVSSVKNNSPESGCKKSESRRAFQANDSCMSCP